MADVSSIVNLITADLRRQRDTQEKDATSRALAAAASARLDTTRADILPSQSAAEIALQRAQTSLTREQAAIVAPESKSRIGLQTTEAGLNRARIGETIANTSLIGANTDLTKTNNAVAKRNGLREISIGEDSLQSVLGGRYSGFRLSDF